MNTADTSYSDVRACYRDFKAAADATDPDGEPVPRKREQLAKRKSELTAASRILWAVADDLRSIEAKIAKVSKVRRAVKVGIAVLEKLLADQAEDLSTRATERGKSPEDRDFTADRNRISALEFAIEAARTGWHDSNLMRPCDPPDLLLSYMMLPPGTDVREVRPLAALDAILAELEAARERAISKAQPYLIGPDASGVQASPT